MWNFSFYIICFLKTYTNYLLDGKQKEGAALSDNMLHSHIKKCQVRSVKYRVHAA